MSAAVIVAGSLATASAGPKDEAVVKGDTVDVSPIRSSLQVGHDGSGNYIAAIPLGNTYELYYGDGKTFYRQRVFGGGSNGGEKTANWTFWAPREHNHGSLNYRDNLFVVSCGSRFSKDERSRNFNLLGDNERAKLLARARFKTLPFKHAPMFLMRNRQGVYYFVDHIRGGKGYRLFVGRRGNLKPYKLIDIVDDSEGMIFVTKKGELHLVVDKNERSAEWTKGKRKDELKNVPVDQNRRLIYNSLGVYDAIKLGTPCEDF